MYVAAGCVLTERTSGERAGGPAAFEWQRLHESDAREKGSREFEHGSCSPVVLRGLLATPRRGRAGAAIGRSAPLVAVAGAYVRDRSPGQTRGCGCMCT